MQKQHRSSSWFSFFVVFWRHGVVDQIMANDSLPSVENASQHLQCLLTSFTIVSSTSREGGHGRERSPRVGREHGQYGCGPSAPGQWYCNFCGWTNNNTATFVDGPIIPKIDVGLALNFDEVGWNFSETSGFAGERSQNRVYFAIPPTSTCFDRNFDEGSPAHSFIHPLRRNESKSSEVSEIWVKQATSTLLCWVDLLLCWFWSSM